MKALILGGGTDGEVLLLRAKFWWGEEQGTSECQGIA
jgi:hypothetical protein